MSRPMQIALVVAVALVGFAGAFVAFGGGSDAPPAEPARATTAPERDAAADAELAAQLGCRAPAHRDPAYEARLETEPDPPAAEGTTFHVLVSRDGQPVTGSRVCLSAAMTDMAHGGASDEAREAAPGRYDASLTFPMRGPWTGTVKVIEPGQPAVAIPVSFDVE